MDRERDKGGLRKRDKERRNRSRDEQEVTEWIEITWKIQRNGSGDREGTAKVGLLEIANGKRKEMDRRF